MTDKNLSPEELTDGEGTVIAVRTSADGEEEQWIVLNQNGEEVGVFYETNQVGSFTCTSENIPIYDANGNEVGVLTQGNYKVYAIKTDENGVRWVITGDLAYMDEDGVVFFVQRHKRMIITSGYNVYPSHIEDILIKHPKVQLCGVIGIPHPYKVQVAKAFIVLKKGIEPDSNIEKELKEYCEINLAKYMIPKKFEFRETLPKTMVGKVNYRELEKEEQNK